MKKFLLLAAVALACVQGRAGWNTNLSVNTQLTPTGMNFYDKEMKTNQSGYTYVSFITPADTTLAYRLQIIDKDGNRVLKNGGMVVSAEAYRTYTTWNNYLQIDKDGNAFFSVHDNRFGNGTFMPTYTIYKFNQNGDKLWSGTVLNDSIGSAYGSGLQMLCTEDNGLLCAYCGTDETINKDYVLVEKLNADGIKEWKQTVFYGSRLSRPYPFLFDAGNGNALVTWVDGASMYSNLISISTGEVLKKNPTEIYSSGYASSKVLEVIDHAVGPNNGAIFTFVDSNKQGRFIYVKSSGQLGLDGDNAGILLDNSYTEDGSLMASTLPLPVYDPEQKVFNCFYKAFDYYSSKTQCLFVQQVDEEGNFKWDGGKTYLPIQTDYKYSYFQMKGIGNGKTAVFYLKQNNSTYAITGHYVLFDNNLDAISEELPFAQSTGSKENLWVSDLTEDNRFFIGWDEKRSGSSYSIFMQDVTCSESTGISSASTADGTLAVPVAYYTLAGMKASAPVNGITLVKFSDGKTVKMAKP